MYSVFVKGRFSAAHRLEGHPGPCSRLHGHTWKVEVEFRGEELDSTGMLVDFSRADSMLTDCIAGLDHAYLNELEEFSSRSPTAENVARFVFECMSGADGMPGVRVASVSVWESDEERAKYAP